MRRSVLIPLLVSVAACRQDPADVVARVGGRPIAAEDLTREMESVPIDNSAYLRTAAGKKELLELLIRRRLVLAEARLSAVEERPDVKRRLAALDEKLLRERMEARDLLVVGEFLRTLKEGPLSVSEDDARKAWATAREVRASHILLSDEAKARELLERLKKGASFEALAREASEDPTGKDRGGDLGYLMRGSMEPTFEDALFALKTNELAGPVATAYGFHVIKRTGERPLADRPFDEAAEAVRQMLENQRLQAWLAAAKKRHAVTTDLEALEKAGPRAAAAAPHPTQ